MKQKLRQYLALFLTFAMVFTMLPVSAVKAEETAGGTALEPITASKFVASGGQTDANSWLIATTDKGVAEGNKQSAAYVEGETASAGYGPLGGSRMAGVAFELPAAIDTDDIASAIVTMTVTGVNNNIGDYWTKLGLLQVDASSYETMSADSEASFSAVGEDYSYAKTVYSTEHFSKTENGSATFDVTDWVKKSLADGDKYAIYRLQTVISGVLVGKTSPALTITLSSPSVELTDEEAVASDAASLTLPASTKKNLTLPTAGAKGSTITWASSNLNVISATGTVTRGEVDTDVTLTATITKGEVSDTKTFSVTVTALPAAEEGVLAEYEFDSDASGITATDLMGKYNAEVKGSGATVREGMLTLPGGANGSNAAYVELPGTLFEGQDTLTISVWLKNETGSGDYAAMYFGNTAHTNYWLLNPNKGGNLKSVWTYKTENGWDSETEVSKTPTSDNWSLYTTVITEDRITAYYNGVLASDVSKTLTTTDFGTGLVAYIGRSTYPDIFYKGGVYGLKVYNRVLSADEILDEYENGEPIDTEAAKSGLKEIMLGENESADVVMKPLNFLTERNKISLVWASSNENVIHADGTVGEPGNTVITVTGTHNGNILFTDSYNITVIDEKTSAINALDAIDIPNKNNIKGNVTLPSVAKNGMSVIWTSSNPDVISVTEKVNENYDSTPAGIVTRQAQDTEVKLTAAITVGEETLKKEFDLTVKSIAQPGTMTDYVFAYFIGDGAGQERIHLAVSQNGLDWEELNNGEAVLESTLGTKGLRDPYICRSPEGDKFYMIATDLNIGSGTSWGAAQTAGSQAIMVWESDDLVNWSKQRMATVSAEINAGCTWAPEFYYDDKTGEYIVFWASKVAPDYNKQRVYYCKTRDFYTFTEPKLWIEKDFSTIDTTVVKEDGVYYRFTKNENDGQKYIFIETSDSLLGEWTYLKSETLEAYNNSNGTAVEGPCCFRINDDDIEGTGGYKWGLLLDNWKYFAVGTKDLKTAVFDKLDNANLPSKPRHGTIINITAEEYDNLVNADFSRPELKNSSLPTYVSTAYTLPEEVVLALGDQDVTVAVSWDEDYSFAEAGSKTVKGTVVSDNQKLDGFEVQKTVTVMEADDKLIYFIDSGIGSWDGETFVSYKNAEFEAPLRNETADQAYTEGSWGIVNPGTSTSASDTSSDVAQRTGNTSSIYNSGWWARNGKNCEYILPLENGTYSFTGYFGEWWNSDRPIKFSAQYTNAQGQTEESKIEDVPLGKSQLQVESTITLRVKGLADGETADVHIRAAKGGSADPVISGLAVRKLSTGAEDAETEKAELIAKMDDIKVSAAAMNVGDSKKLTVEYPKELTDTTKYTCTAEYKVADADKAIASVDAEGTIEALAAGEAELIAVFTLKEGTETLKTVTKTTKVTVTKSAQQLAVETVKADLDKIKLDKANYELTAGDSAVITVNYPEGFEAALKTAGLEKTVTYSSQNASVTVDKDGKLTAAAAGTATITVTISLNDADAASKVLTASVKVNAKTTGDSNNNNNNNNTNNDNNNNTNKDPITSTPDTTPAKIKLDVAKSISMGIGEKVTAKATVTNKAGETLKDQKLNWSVDKKGQKAVTVKNGKITAKKAGTANITVKTSNGKTAKIKVTVKKKVTKIKITAKKLKKGKVTLKKGQTLKLGVKLTPSKSATYKITYKSNKKKVASVSDKGVVKALKKGTATITVQTYNKKKATIKVTVK